MWGLALSEVFGIYGESWNIFPGDKGGGGGVILIAYKKNYSIVLFSHLSEIIFAPMFLILNHSSLMIYLIQISIHFKNKWISLKPSIISSTLKVFFLNPFYLIGLLPGI